jgi:N-methylhydantoinase A/oxoprolinase/acetone carboxylase beta subunit
MIDIGGTVVDVAAMEVESGSFRAATVRSTLADASEARREVLIWLA